MHTFIHQTDREPKGTGFSLSSKAFLAFIEGVMLLPVEGRVSRRDFTLREIEEGRSDSANKVIFYNVTKTYSFDVTRIFQRHLRVILLFISNLLHQPSRNIGNPKHFRFQTWRVCWMRKTGRIQHLQKEQEKRRPGKHNKLLPGKLKSFSQLWIVLSSNMHKK